MNDLVQYFDNNTGRIIHKWAHYFEVYDRYFSRFRGQSPTILEIGVNFGGSLEMWRDYFGPGARIIGIDINPECAKLQEEGFDIVIGDQADPKFWAEFRTRFPKLDLLIDDGGHEFHQQRVTFEQMFDHIKDDGVYFCEDMHTSYIRSFRGGLRQPASFVEYCKGLIDELNAHWSEEPGFRKTRLTSGAKSVCFHDSIVVVEKGPVEPPYDLIKGTGAEQHMPYRQRKAVPTATELATMPPAGAVAAAGARDLRSTMVDLKATMVDLKATILAARAGRRPG